MLNNNYRWIVMLDFICKGSMDLHRRETCENFKWKYMTPPGIQLATLGLPAGHPHRLAIEMVVYLHFKLFHYSEITANSGELWKNKHATIQCIKLFLVIYVLQQTDRQIPLDICRCYLLLLKYFTPITGIPKDQKIVETACLRFWWNLLQGCLLG